MTLIAAEFEKERFLIAFGESVTKPRHATGAEICSPDIQMHAIVQDCMKYASRIPTSRVSFHGQLGLSI